MNFDEYQRDAARTSNDGRLFEDRIANAALGLAGEAGEFADMAKKWLYHGHTLHNEAAAKELGDVLWYVA
ncbi:MAG: nucleoside triphosphate pyrophosphohydrolase family protein, partial [bacterium]|nr:nucleoside triphosphate pyrophosphohydrolase family protein [bacterium]